MYNKPSIIRTIDEVRDIVDSSAMIAPGLPADYSGESGWTDAQKIFALVQQHFPNSILAPGCQDTTYYASISLPSPDAPSKSRFPLVILSTIAGLSTIQHFQFLGSEAYAVIVEILIESGRTFVPYELFGPYQSHGLAWDGLPDIEFTHEDLWRSLFDYL